MAKTEKQPPAIIAEEFNPWGDLSDADITDAAINDPWYISGYSDKRRAQELEAAQGKSPDPLPYRFQYVSTARTSGAPDNTKAAEYSTKRYIPVMYDDAAKFGIDVKKSGFVRAPDGTCRVANQMLMVVSRKIADVHARALREKTRALTDSVGSKLEQAVDDFNARVGQHYGHAEVEKEETLHKG
jgi:hypothetical protein